MLFVILSVLYVICFSFLISTCYCKKMASFHVPAKTVTSLFFLAMAAYVLFRGEMNLSAYLCLLAFFFCLLGDVFLAIHQQFRAEWGFPAGLVSFLLAHCLFMKILAEAAPFRFWDLIPVVVMMGVSWIVMSLPSMNPGKMKVPAVIYCFFVSMLFVKGIELPFYQGRVFRPSCLRRELQISWCQTASSAFCFSGRKKYAPCSFSTF